MGLEADEAQVEWEEERRDSKCVGREWRWAGGGGGGGGAGFIDK